MTCALISLYTLVDHFRVSIDLFTSPLDRVGHDCRTEGDLLVVSCDSPVVPIILDTEPPQHKPLDRSHAALICLAQAPLGLMLLLILKLHK